MKSAFALILKMHKSTDVCQHWTVNYIIRKVFKNQWTFLFAGLAKTKQFFIVYQFLQVAMRVDYTFIVIKYTSEN